MFFQAVKDPDAKLDFTINWEPWLKEVDDVISSTTAPTWIIPSGLTKHQESNTSYKSTVWVSAGVPGTTYVLVNRITTQAGRIDDRSIQLTIVER